MSRLVAHGREPRLNTCSTGLPISSVENPGFDYDQGVSGYASVRRADPRTASQIHAALGDAMHVRAVPFALARHGLTGLSRRRNRAAEVVARLTCLSARPNVAVALEAHFARICRIPSRLSLKRHTATRVDDRQS